MKTPWSIELLILIAAITISIIGSILIIRINWKKYGLLYILSAVTGNLLCYIFIKFGFYSFPIRLFPTVFSMPFEAILTAFPFLVILSVRFSPKEWSYKIPFYWVIVHLGMLGETLILLKTGLITYNFKWDFWDSYTWWWIYFLLFEWIGGLIIPQNSRNPISSESFRYGKWAWILLHFILIITIFLGGIYLGKVLSI